MELKKQAKEIIENNGRCPANTLCDGCIYKVVNGTVNGCNPSTVIKVAQKVLNPECPECGSKWDVEHNRCSSNCQTIL